MPTPQRKVRVDDETWDAWGEYASEHGLSVSEFIRRSCTAMMVMAAGANVMSDGETREKVRQAVRSAQPLARREVTPIPKKRR